MKTVHSRNFGRDLRKLKDKKLLARVAAVIKEVEEAETIGAITNLQKLTDYEHAYRVRIGKYRLGLLCDEGLVVFARFLHRKDICREFP